MTLITPDSSAAAILLLAWLFFILARRFAMRWSVRRPSSSLGPAGTYAVVLQRWGAHCVVGLDVSPHQINVCLFQCFFFTHACPQDNMFQYSHNYDYHAGKDGERDGEAVAARSN